MPGSIKLLRLWGIDVFLHWSWALIAIFQVQRGKHEYGSVLWSALEYIGLFTIVTMHEFGHALACRSVGGRADKIMLWPLGGVAFVQPPPRAGAQLWSIFAGPLVNLILIFPLYFAYSYFHNSPGNIGRFLYWMNVINIGLFIFNMLPIYPLDGGQILRSILWFFVGPSTSLKVASVIGLAGSGLGLGLAIFTGDVLLIIVALFAGMQSWSAFQASRRMSEPVDVPWHIDWKCPACGNSPPAMPIWQCDQCRTMFDTFATGFACPNCRKQFDVTGCPHCRQMIRSQDWLHPKPGTM